jgi:hypothetical protein
MDIIEPIDLPYNGVDKSTAAGIGDAAKKGSG